MSSPPTVDVNLFVYNGATMVSEAIDSVLAQTWPHLTLTLIDDGSTDGTLQVLQDQAAQHPAIRIKRNRNNGGAIPNFQRAFWLGDFRLCDAEVRRRCDRSRLCRAAHEGAASPSGVCDVSRGGSDLSR